MGKPVPYFWWDYGYNPDVVVVESSDNRFTTVKAWPGHSEANIAAAEKLIADLRAGRVDPRRVR